MKNTRKIIAMLIVAVMIFSVMPLSALAVEAVSYTEVDYSTVYTVGEEVSYSAEETDPYINPNDWGGYAKGFTVELEAGKEYTFAMVGDNYIAEYIDRAFALMPETLSGDETVDFLVSNSGYDEMNGFVSFALSFTVETTGSYKILLWGYVSDWNYNYFFGKETHEFSFVIDETDSFPTEMTIDVNNKDELFDVKSKTEALKTTKNALVEITLNINSNIDLGDAEWDSIFLNNKLVVNGKNHVIKGLTNPLFGLMKTIEIYDLGLEVEFVFDDITKDYYCASPLFGYADNAVISNCHATGSITATANYIESVSGLFGDIWENGTIENCSSDVDITLTAGEESVAYIGGLSGYIYGSFSDDMITLKNCHYDGNITVNGGGTEKTHEYIGGLVGSCSSVRFENCSAKGSIVAESEWGVSDVGGLCGEGYYIDALNCYTDVDINIPTGDRVGGFIGDRYGDSVYKNCYALGNVVGDDYVGGFVGFGSIDGIFANCYANGDVEGFAYVGGFGGVSSKNTFQQCYASGTVTAVSDSSYSYSSFIGYCDKDPSFETCYVQDSELDMIKINTTPTTFDLSELDFADNTAVSAAVDKLNAAVENAVDPELLTWVHADGKTPSFELPAVESPKKPCGHITDGGWDDADDENHWELCENPDCPNADEHLNEAKHNFKFVSDSADCVCNGTLVEKCSDCEHIRETESQSKGHVDEDGNKICDICDYAEYMLGDVDGDNDVDADDYIVLKRVYFGQAKLENLKNPETASIRSDVKKDGTINADDYILLKRVYFGQVKL